MAFASSLTVLATTQLGLDSALEFSSIPERSQVVGNGSNWVGWANFPIRGERWFGPWIGDEAIWIVSAGGHVAG